MAQSGNIFLDDAEFLAKLLVGIGEVSAITGIPQRQIRYWEAKDIITSVSGSGSNTRRYDYMQIKKMLLIKEMLDEGFTLDAAARKVTDRMKTFNEIFNKLKKSVK